jgi:polysaccharide biosynthesis protein PslH
VVSSGRWIVVAHNVESQIWQRYGENEQNALKRWYIRRQWHKFERFEERILRMASRTIAVSDADARLMRDQFGATHVDVIDNGVDSTFFQPNGFLRDAHRLLFLGSLDWRPNLDAVKLLLTRIFPRVLAEEPSTRLTIVGRKPPRWLVNRVRRCRGVELHADVPDVRPFLGRCGLMVVPLRIGGGSRLKILESLAAECPVVSTRVGAEGLRLVPGEHFVQVDTADDMPAALIEHIRRPAPIRTMARRGRTVVARQYNWPDLAVKLESIWMQAADTREAHE